MKLKRLEGKNFNILDSKGNVIASVKHVSKYDGSYEINTIYSNATAWALRQSDIIRWTKKILDSANVQY